ncbi:hypothetical protein IJI31_07350 [bacterium]|nr:hypothetical protein [bacterium]
MKKFILTLMMLSFATMSANATNVIVESLDNIEQNSNSRIFSAKVLEDATLKTGEEFKEGSVLKSEIVKKVDAQRGKRSGYIVIQPISMEYNGTETYFEGTDIEATVKGYSKKSWKDLGTKAGLSAGLAAGSRKIPGFSQVFYFSKGFLKPEEDQSRFKSGVTSAYENSPFAYINKGEEINIETGDMLVLKFYHSEVPKWRVLKRND